MQAIGLIMNDDFLLQFNISISTNDLMLYIKKIFRPWVNTLYGSIDSQASFILQIDNNNILAVRLTIFLLDSLETPIYPENFNKADREKYP